MGPISQNKESILDNEECIATECVFSPASYWQPEYSAEWYFQSGSSGPLHSVIQYGLRAPSTQPAGGAGQACLPRRHRHFTNARLLHEGASQTTQTCLRWNINETKCLWLIHWMKIHVGRDAPVAERVERVPYGQPHRFYSNLGHFWMSSPVSPIYFLSLCSCLCPIQP